MQWKISLASHFRIRFISDWIRDITCIIMLLCHDSFFAIIYWNERDINVNSIIKDLTRIMPGEIYSRP